MKVGGRFYGMLHLSAKRHRSMSDGKTPYERRFGQNLNRGNPLA